MAKFIEDFEAVKITVKVSISKKIYDALVLFWYTFTKAYFGKSITLFLLVLRTYYYYTTC